MLEIDIPSRGVLRLEHLVLDMNGTIALDGQLVPTAYERLGRLSKKLDLWLVSADTQGTLTELATALQVKHSACNPAMKRRKKLRSRTSWARSASSPSATARTMQQCCSRLRWASPCWAAKAWRRRVWPPPMWSLPTWKRRSTCCSTRAD
jgi:hypothetical protein